MEYLDLINEHDLNISLLPIDIQIELIQESDGLLIDLLKGKTIDRHLHLIGCTSLTHMPGMLVNGHLNLTACASLVDISEDLEVWGHLFLSECTSLVRLPKLRVTGTIYCDGCTSLVDTPAINHIVLPVHLQNT